MMEVPALTDVRPVQGRVEARDPGVPQEVPDHAEGDACQEDDQRQPLYDGLPGPDPPVIQEEQTHRQPCQGATEMAHEASPVFRVVQADVDGEAHVVDREQQDEDRPDDHRYRLLHNLQNTILTMNIQTILHNLNIIDINLENNILKVRKCKDYIKKDNLIGKCCGRWKCKKVRFRKH